MSYSIESGDGLHILHRALLHLKQHADAINDDQLDIVRQLMMTFNLGKYKFPTQNSIAPNRYSRIA
jgi:hypothetical protein